MKNYLLLNLLSTFLKRSIFIFLISTVIILITFTKSFSQEKIFIVSSVKVNGTIDLNFSRDKYLDKAFFKSFKMLMTKILISSDLKKINNIKLKTIKSLIKSFQILEEDYKKDEYNLNVKIFYNDKKLKKFLRKKNLSFSQTENISVIFYPLLFKNNEMQDFNENFFYNKWNEVEVENELINFILPIEDLDDISRIVEMKYDIENLDVDNLINKYDEKNYVFVLMELENNKLSIYLKTKFNDNIISKNILYDLKNLEDEESLIKIIKDLKLKIIDVWKQQNLINLLIPLSLKIKYNHNNIENLDNLRKIFNEIIFIQSYSLDEFDVKNSFFKIYYFGNPKKLKSELLKYGYLLKNDQGSWLIYLNE